MTQEYLLGVVFLASAHLLTAGVLYCTFPFAAASWKLISHIFHRKHVGRLREQ
jgi:hypothetical protein